jgi:hypothetical protein
VSSQPSTNWSSLHKSSSHLHFPWTNILNTHKLWHVVERFVTMVDSTTCINAGYCLLYKVCEVVPKRYKNVFINKD